MIYLDEGYRLINDVFSPVEILDILETIENHIGDTNYTGIRNIEKKIPKIKNLCNSEKLFDLAKNHLGKNTKFVRAIIFNKTSQYNWPVSWHQDKTFAVSKRIDDPSWGPWSIKDDVLHAQVPLNVLENSITIRLHIDPASNKNGCLKIIPYSHKLGLLNERKIATIAKKEKSIECTGKAGSVLIMKPHLLHSSSRASNPTQRRVLHLEYSCYNLPKGVTWV